MGCDPDIEKEALEMATIFTRSSRRVNYPVLKNKKVR